MTPGTVYAGDVALYKPRKGEPRRCEVLSHTAKRVKVVIRDEAGALVVRYVIQEKLKRARGGGSARWQ